MLQNDHIITCNIYLLQQTATTAWGHIKYNYYDCT